jgi:hypothetical protein
LEAVAIVTSLEGQVFIWVCINDHRGSQTSYASDCFHGEIEPKLPEFDQ